MKRTVNNCPVCRSASSQQIDQDKNRTYQKCADCGLVYVPRDQLVTVEKEFQRYQHHQNETADPSYRKYLSDIQSACEPFLQSGDEGLDFGCGPSPVLGSLYQERGFNCLSYDLFFHPGTNYEVASYNFISLCEVIEHLRDPAEILIKLSKLLRKNGKIFIHTKFYPELSTFPNWFYKRDLTHIQFFNESSMNRIAQLAGLQFVKEIRKDLYMLQRAD